MDVSFLKSAFHEKHYPAADRPEIAFAGRSNVGKSSLINRLVNRKKLARTGSTPGRTQSINFFGLGDIMYLVDLPGYGFARVPMKVRKSWQSMVETYLRTRSNLKGVVVILDIRREPATGDLDLLKWLNHFEIPAILVLTKADKVSRQKARNRAKRIGGQIETVFAGTPILFSARTGEGRQILWDRIQEQVGSDLMKSR